MSEVVFVSGKYRGDIEINIAHAMRVAKELWQQGYIVICPHLNTAHFDGICTDNTWLQGYLEILARCDSIFMLRNWQESEGAKAELALAQKLEKRIYWE
jgi:cell division GTPase FtsZ